MHSGDLSEIDQASLSGQEREALLQVMERAKEFDRQLNSSGPVGVEGQLFKWTNPLKGWQPRWFSVDHQQGVLHYYTSEDRKKHAPRGSLHLWGAVVAPSEEDSQSFSVNGANGEVYKLRGQDAKERQFWVSRLRREVENLTNQTFTRDSVDSAGSELNTSTSPRTAPPKAFGKRITSLSLHRSRPGGRVVSTASINSSKSGGSTTESKLTATAPREQEPALLGVDQFPGGDAMLEVLMRLQTLQEQFSLQLQTNSSQVGLSPTDKEVLLSRATAQAAVTSVKDCLALLKLHIKEPQLPSEGSPQHHVVDRSLLEGGGGKDNTLMDSKP